MIGSALFTAVNAIDHFGPIALVAPVGSGHSSMTDFWKWRMTEKAEQEAVVASWRTSVLGRQLASHLAALAVCFES